MTASATTVADIARVCHEANRAVQIITGDANVNGEWMDVSIEVRWTAKNGVRAFLENEDMTPEKMHASWSEAKLLDGWTHGPIKDWDAKTHPCLLPYDELPEGQRLKDRVFINVIKAFQEHYEAEGLFGL